MAQITLVPPDSHTKAPATRDENAESGWSFRRIVEALNTMFTELYSGAVFAGEAQTISGVQTFSAEPQTSVGVGAVAGSGVSVVETGNDVIHRTTFTLAHTMAITDADAAGAHGSAKIYDFPEGHILILGAHAALDLVGGEVGIDADAVLDLGVGSAAAGVDNDELATTEANVIHADEVALVDSEASLSDVLTANLALDGSSAAASLYLNVAVDADDVDDDDTLEITGTVTVLWTKLGDN